MREFYKIYKELTLIFVKLFQEIEEEGVLPNSFCEASTPVISKPDKDSKRTENCRPISSMNIHSKISANY